MGIFPNFRGENKKYLSCHHLDNHGDFKSPVRIGVGLDPFQMAELHG